MTRLTATSAFISSSQLLAALAALHGRGNCARARREGKPLVQRSPPSVSVPAPTKGLGQAVADGGHTTVAWLGNRSVVVELCVLA
jgi:hypothetical protein